MKNVLLCAVALVTVSLFASAAAGEIQLPAPQKTGGMPLFEAIDQRASARSANFPATRIPESDLSTILWAASGHNRDGRLWTVPMAMGKPPYCKIYVTTAEGVYRYDWANHALDLVRAGNVHGDIPMQQFAKNAPQNIYIVGDGQALTALDSPFSEEFGLVLAGAMSQNIYLACQGLDVGARLIYSIRREEATSKLGLAPGDKPYFAIIMGKK